MPFLYKWKSLWNRRLRQDLDDEITSHIEMRTEQLIAAGHTPGEARAAARRQFGNPTLAREHTRESHIFMTLETMLQDVAYGLRILRRQPLFTLTAVATLALVIGANGAIFSILDAVLLKPLPFPKPEQLVLIFSRENHQNRLLSFPDLEDFRAVRSFSSLAGLWNESISLSGEEQPARYLGTFVSPQFLPLLGIHPILGRTFAAGDDQPGSARVCLLSEPVWRSRYGADPNIVGRSLILNGEPSTVIGVLPPYFGPLALSGDIWVPLVAIPHYSRERSVPLLVGLARLANGASLERTQADLATVSHRLALQYPDTNRDRGAMAFPLQSYLTRDERPTLVLLGASVICVLLIGCANMAGLLLAKSAGRRHEIAVRTSLGASSKRLVRQLLTESILLALLGGAVGALLSQSVARLIASRFYSDVKLAAVNPRDLLYVAAISILAGLAFGLAPALAARRTATDVLRQRGAGSTQSNLRNTLVAAQVALAFILLLATGLMLKSIQSLLRVDVGFNSDRVLTLEYRLPKNKYQSGIQSTAFHNEVVARVSALPGVDTAGIIRGLPFSFNGESANIALPDRPEPPREHPLTVRYNAITPTYFAAMRIPLLDGRPFATSDGPSSARVIIVSRSFVDRFWPNQGAIGRQALIPEHDPGGAVTKLVPATIVGIVGDVKHDTLDETSLPGLYVPYPQDPYLFATLVVRAKADPMSIVRDVQRAFWSVDKDQPMWKIRTLESLVDNSTASRRLTMLLLACFSGVALLLASIGLYGVLAYLVGQRTGEFGIRLALGAKPVDILGLVMRKGLALAAAGLVMGALASLPLTSLIRSQLFGVKASDPVVYITIAALLLALALIAMILPARRATRIDPASALRLE
ncbi:MAG TPA: ABC transporter permease [Bryobacteraceae bacterium]|nr:ABC transporter permease [Bryobacteraceae bacterium]